jgi:hypothetical protein
MYLKCARAQNQEEEIMRTESGGKNERSKAEDVAKRIQVKT